jgi:cytochrome oxidase assembly protein ShyY1
VTSQLFSPRAFGLGLVAAVLMASMVVLGLWQLGVYDDHQQDDARARLDRAPVPLADVLGPDDAFPSDAVSIPVTLTGRYLSDQEFAVHGSDALGVASAVVTPLALDDGSAVLVVRGADGGVPAPSGEVDVTGVLEPSDATGDALDADRVTDGIRIAALVSAVDVDLYAGYVVRTTSDPADASTPVAAPTPDPSRLAGLRNLVYAVQWWVFAAFVAFMWWRIVTEPSRPNGGSEAEASSPNSVG